VRGLALAVLLTSASPLVCQQPAPGGLGGCKAPQDKNAWYNMAVSVPSGPERPSPQSPPVPDRQGPREPLDFRGPGREVPEPDVTDVMLGWFGPGDPDHPEFGELWRGATLALEQENAAGGYRGKPFRLEPAWSESPWQAGIRDVTRLVYERGAWAVLGGVDGTTTHLAVQVALKAHFLLLSPGSTDATADHANVPWLFSLPPSDDAIAPPLAAAVVREAAGGPFAVVAGTDHDSRAALASLRRALASHAPSFVVEVAPEEDLAAVGTRLLAAAPRVVVILAPAGRAGRCVAALRAAGFEGVILGGAPLGRAAFAHAAGRAVDGTIVPLLAAFGPQADSFATAYEARWRQRPDASAALGYDAVRLAAAAVRRAGLNRALIRDAVRALAPWPGASGVVRWNALGRSDAPVRLGRWRDGRLEPLLQ